MSWSRLALASALVLSPRLADAAVVREAGFAMEIRGASTCFLYPASLHAEADCAGLAAVRESDLAPVRDDRLFAIAVMRDSATQRVVGMAEIFRIQSEEEWPDQQVAAMLITRTATDMRGVLPPAANPRPGSARIETVNEIRVIRGTVDVDGLTTGSQEQLMLEHHELLSVHTRSGYWLVQLSGQRADASTLKAIADATLPTIVLDAKQRPGRNVSRQLVQLLIAIGAITTVVIVLVKRRSRQRR